MTPEAVASLTTVPYTLGRVVLTAVRGRIGTAKVFVVTVALPVSMTCVAVDKARVLSAAASVDAAVVVLGLGTMANRGVVVSLHGTVDPVGATTATNVIITGEITLAIRFPPGFETFEGGIKTVTQTTKIF